MKLKVFLTNWLPERTPRAIQNSRLFSMPGHEGEIFLPRLSVNPIENPGSALKITQLFNPKKNVLLKGLTKAGLSFNIPDIYVFWAWQAYRESQKKSVIAAPDLLISVSKYDSAHLPCLWIRRKKSIPWIAMFSDPWTDMEKFGYTDYRWSWIRKANIKLEKKVCETADCIVVTNAVTKRLFVDKYGEAISSKIKILPQGFDREKFDQLQMNTSPAMPTYLTLRYLGDFYGHRSPLPLIEAMEELQNTDKELYDLLHIEFYGHLRSVDRAIVERKLADHPNITFPGTVSFEQSLALAVSADVLLVIDAMMAESPFLPSKLIEYIGANRAIIGITPPGAASDLIAEINGMVAAPDNRERIVQLLREVVKRWRAGSLQELAPNPSLRQRFTVESMNRQFAQIMQETVTNFS